MSDAYANAESVSLEQYVKLMATFDRSAATKSNAEDILKIEEILLVQEGTLAAKNMYMQKTECSCGRSITFYDAVYTSLKQGHDTSLVLHSILGAKHIVQRPRDIICSNCGTTIQNREYEVPHGYGCCS